MCGAYIAAVWAGGARYGQPVTVHVDSAASQYISEQGSELSLTTDMRVQTRSQITPAGNSKNCIVIQDMHEHKSHLISSPGSPYQVGSIGTRSPQTPASFSFLSHNLASTASWCAESSALLGSTLQAAMVASSAPAEAPRRSTCVRSYCSS